LLKRTAKIVPHADVISIGVGSVVVAAAELAKIDGVDILFAGLGSEEIFAGYERHVKAKDVNEECWNGLTNVIWERDFTRDAAIATKMKFTVRVPFLDDEVIKTAMGISGEHKIREDQKKVILREIAESTGLPKEIAWRKKKAAQYGSGFDKALEQLAKQKKMQKSEFVKTL
ncbi:MAG TPA: asparagine synthase-related protein, partial [Candidatus Nanoarchaeia archaeon]|nr:asparagine synthase-related protein [Candidatus Nanoarchaeia archaeon]